MSTNQFKHFMQYVENNEELKKKVEAVLKEYAGAKLTAKEMESIIRERIQPLAASAGFKIDPADMPYQFKAKETTPLTENELEEAVGGRGQLEQKNGLQGYEIHWCEIAPDDEFFKKQWYQGGCPYFVDKWGQPIVFL